MYDSILVPTDGSDHAVAGANHALALAELFDATVHALAVVDVEAAAGPFSAGGVDEEFREQLRSQATEHVDAIVAKSDSPDRIERHVVEGNPASEILAAVETHDADLIAMGTHGRSGLKRFLVGSVAEHVLRESPVPVLAVRATDDGPAALPYEEILVPTDGSECAMAAVDHALAIASAADARLHALNVVEAGALPSEPGVPGPADYLDEFENAGEEMTAEVADRAAKAGVETKTAVRRGRVATDIDEYASANDADLIVMGTHGRSGLDRFLLGSATERLLRGSDRPLLAVPAPETDD